MKYCIKYLIGCTRRLYWNGPTLYCDLSIYLSVCLSICLMHCYKELHPASGSLSVCCLSTACTREPSLQELVCSNILVQPYLRQYFLPTIHFGSIGWKPTRETSSRQAARRGTLAHSRLGSLSPLSCNIAWRAPLVARLQ